MPGDKLSMDVAVQFAIQVVVALVLQRRATGRALEAFHVQILVLNSHEHATVTNTSILLLNKH